MHGGVRKDSKGETELGGDARAHKEKSKCQKRQTSKPLLLT